MNSFIRFFVLGLTLSSTLAFANVDSKKIKSVAKSLGALMADSKVYKVKPASPLEMMKELAAGPLEMGDDFTFDQETATSGDSGAWGFVKMAEAISWVANAEYLNVDENGEEITNSPKAKKAANLVRSLIGTGVVFGAGPFGAVQCGGTYPALLMIDTKAGVIYTFETEGSGC
jgi:hypothetical protein